MRCIADEVPFDIPDTWEWVRLGQLVYNHGQITPNEKFCYIDIGSIDNHKQRLNSSNTVLEANAAPSRARKIVKEGDILYSTVRPYLHNMCVVNRAFPYMPIASTGFAVMRTHADYFSSFLFYYLSDLPECDDFIETTYFWLKVGDDDDEVDVVAENRVPSRYIEAFGEPDVAGRHYSAEISTILEDTDYYSAFVKMLDDDNFVYKIQYRQARECLAFLKSKQKKSDASLLDLL